MEPESSAAARVDSDSDISMRNGSGTEKESGTPTLEHPLQLHVIGDSHISDFGSRIMDDFGGLPLQTINRQSTDNLQMVEAKNTHLSVVGDNL